LNLLFSGYRLDRPERSNNTALEQAIHIAGRPDNFAGNALRNFGLRCNCSKMDVSNSGQISVRRYRMISSSRALKIALTR